MKPNTCTRPSSECNIHCNESVTTLLSWLPIYDGDGNIKNTDPNKTITKFFCSTCQKSWEYVEQGGIKYQLFYDE